jgi:hypothetical protein
MKSSTIYSASIADVRQDKILAVLARVKEDSSNYGYNFSLFYFFLKNNFKAEFDQYRDQYFGKVVVIDAGDLNPNYWPLCMVWYYLQNNLDKVIDRFPSPETVMQWFYKKHPECLK